MYRGPITRGERNLRSFFFPSPQSVYLQISAALIPTDTGLPPRGALPRARIIWGDGQDEHNIVCDLAGRIAVLLSASKVTVNLFGDTCDNITPTPYVEPWMKVVATCAPGSGACTPITYTTETLPSYTSNGAAVPSGATHVRAERIVGLPFAPASTFRSPSLPPGYLGIYSYMMGTPGDPYIYTAYDLPSLVEREVAVPAASTILADPGSTASTWWYSPPVITMGPGETFRLVWRLGL